jgi:hypothetical protein
VVGRWRQLFGRLAATLLLVALALHDPDAQEAVYDVDQVKAAFLYHFATYVTWPAPARAEPLTIAVLGDDGVAAQLSRFLPGRRIESRSVQARAIGRIEDLADEEILFIGRSSNPSLAQVIARIGRRPVLVVTDAPNGLDSGGMINLREVDSRVRFEISVPRAEEAGLTLSSRLLAAAQRVVTSQCCPDPATDIAASLNE